MKDGLVGDIQGGKHHLSSVKLAAVCHEQKSSSVNILLCI